MLWSINESNSHGTMPIALEVGDLRYSIKLYFYCFTLPQTEFRRLKNMTVFLRQFE